MLYLRILSEDIRIKHSPGDLGFTKDNGKNIFKRLRNLSKLMNRDRRCKDRI